MIKFIINIIEQFSQIPSLTSFLSKEEANIVNGRFNFLLVDNTNSKQVLLGNDLLLNKIVLFK